MHRLLFTATAVFVLVAAVSVITHSANDVIGTTTTAPARHYYLTKTAVTGSGALTACSTGYHFASFAEISDLSDLTYNKTLGQTLADSGQGPPILAQNVSTTPANGAGWIRTGAPSLAAAPANTGDVANCSVWTTASSTAYGEFAFLSLFVNSYGAAKAPLVNFATGTCNNSLRVWCVQN
jgi:hypothetical protein